MSGNRLFAMVEATVKTSSWGNKPSTSIALKGENIYASGGKTIKESGICTPRSLYNDITTLPTQKRR